MSLNVTQGISIKFDGITEIFLCCFGLRLCCLCSLAKGQSNFLHPYGEDGRPNALLVTQLAPLINNGRFRAIYKDNKRLNVPPAKWSGHLCTFSTNLNFIVQMRSPLMHVHSNNAMLKNSQLHTLMFLHKYYFFMCIPTDFFYEHLAFHNKVRFQFFLQIQGVILHLRLENQQCLIHLLYKL